LTTTTPPLGAGGLSVQSWPNLAALRTTPLPADVQALFDQAAVAEPQFSWAWYQHLGHTALPPGQHAALHVLRRHGVALAALPLLVRTGAGGQRLGALCTYYSSLFAPAVAAGVTAAELAVLLQHLRLAHAPLVSLTLAPLAGDAPLFGVLQRALQLAGLRSFDYFCFGNWFLPLQATDRDGDPPAANSTAYLAARPGDVRNTLRRMGKKFAAAGGRLQVLHAPADATLAATLFTAVYGSSWKQPEPHTQFIPGLVQLCAQQGWLRMGVAWVGDQPCAAQLWMVAGGRASIYKLAYDPAFKPYSPGTLLTAHLMQHVIDTDGVHEVDYLTGDDAYKNQWMSHRRERRGLLAYNLHNPVGLWGAAQEATRRAVKPWFERWRGTRPNHHPRTGADAAAQPTGSCTLTAR
jgi:Acetyltransferase (GNAT) domain